jgi:hypothetical protein
MSTYRIRRTCVAPSGIRGAVDIAPEEAIEAALDPRALIARDPKSGSGEAVRVVGYSAAAGRVLVVVLLPHEHPPRGLWQVATAWPADRRLREAYAADLDEQGCGGGAMTDYDRELLDKIAAEAEHAESTRDVDLDYRRRSAPGGSRVYGLRLPADRIEQLRRLAEARGVEPSALARQWVIAQLDAAEHRRDDAQERWERDLRETAEHLRHLLDERPGA